MLCSHFPRVVFCCLALKRKPLETLEGRTDSGEEESIWKEDALETEEQTEIEGQDLSEEEGHEMESSQDEVFVNMEDEGNAAEGSGSDIYQAEIIFKMRKRQKRVEYLVKWASCGYDQCTWEPEENLIDKRLIDNFKKWYNTKWDYLVMPCVFSFREHHFVKTLMRIKDQKLRTNVVYVKISVFKGFQLYCLKQEGTQIRPGMLGIFL